MKKIIAAILSVMMFVTIFTACGNSGSSTSTSAGSNAGEQKEATQSESSGEVTKIKMTMLASGEAADLAKVQEAVNKITVEKIGVELEITFVNFGSWIQQTNLMLSGGDEIDILPVFMSPLTTFVNNGQIIPIDDVYEQYGQDIKTVIDESYINCGRIDGKLYGITTNRDLAVYYGAWMRKDLCDKYGIDYENMTTLEQYEAALRVIKENEPDMYPCVTSNGQLVEAWGWDRLGDGKHLGVLLNRGDNLDVVNLYDSDTFVDFTTMTRRWSQDGLIMPDAVNNTESSANLVKAGKGFSALNHMKPGFETQQERATGYEIVTVKFIDAFASTTNAQGLVWGITNTCKTPDKAMQFLNLAYTDPEISNLLVYGIEGDHYVMVDEANDTIGYPEGVDVSNSGYPGGLGWAWPNQFISHVWQGDPPTIWQDLDEFNKIAYKSQAIGFTFDSSNVKTEYTACSNVVDKYLNALLAGAVDPVETLPIFNQELKDAGIEKIIAEKQSQLDTWSANK